MRLYIVDAFADELFGGNPAGVVLIGGREDFPKSELMRGVAAELRYSETAFIKMLGNGRFLTKYFTSASEVDLCGHATIAAFSVLREAEVVRTGEVCINETLAGDLCVEIGENAVWMEMGAPELLGIIEGEELSELCAIMGVGGTAECISGAVRKVSTGLPDIMLPLKNEAELANLKPDFSALAKYSKRHGVVGVHAFAYSERDVSYHARNFAPLYGINEEAATGTANAALLYYLYTNESADLDVVYTVVQGEKMGRPSKIRVKIEKCPEPRSPKEQSVAVKVGGAAVILAAGDIFI